MKVNDVFIKQPCAIYERRRFLELGLSSAAAFCFGCSKAEGKNEDTAVVAPDWLTEARFYEKINDNLVQCLVCPRECVIPDGKRGYCGTRENRGGTLYTVVYGRVVSAVSDPIEKKPFFHVLPGTKAFSIATAGCNMTCKFCQNWTLSQSKPEELRSQPMTPEQVAETAFASRTKSIAYTYNEPTVFTEFVYDCAVAGKNTGIHSVVISNGYINPEPVERLGEVLTAYKVDLKAFSDTFYRDITGGDLQSVLNTIKLLKKLDVWVEIVHLTIPTLNDDSRDLTAMADWLTGEVGTDIPVHFTRFHPMYRLTNLPVTPVSTLERARNILMEKGMKFVYIGNVPGHPAESTYCPNCGKKLIERGYGWSVGDVYLKEGACVFCGTPIPGVWA
ncbi:MAG: AmmeMemoRadiSam system radical SAM enzyme [Candidatus Latescibacteria bacterium]|nr:AmmeMemoRadiSam system radical SAM enzyme [Candidatus Latescibacterota bacterium]